MTLETASDTISSDLATFNHNWGVNLTCVYVRCKVLRGLFDTEFYVLVNGSSSAYVAQRYVKISGNRPQGKEEVDGQVFAYVINKEESRSLIEVPGEPVVGGLRTWVPNDILASA